MRRIVRQGIDIVGLEIAVNLGVQFGGGTVAEHAGAALMEINGGFAYHNISMGSVSKKSRF